VTGRAQSRSGVRAVCCLPVPQTGTMRTTKRPPRPLLYVQIVAVALLVAGGVLLIVTGARALVLVPGIVALVYGIGYAVWTARVHRDARSGLRPLASCSVGRRR